jgi:hypothetical protein
MVWRILMFKEHFPLDADSFYDAAHVTPRFDYARNKGAAVLILAKNSRHG